MRRFLGLMSSLSLLTACGGFIESEGSNIESSTASTSVSFGDATKDTTHKPGFFDLYIDEASGKVLAALPAPDEDGLSLKFIYATGLTAGLGSNPIGLDRGAFDSGVIVAFRKVGNKVIAEQENWKYRATSDNPREQLAVRESFARSFLWSGEISETADDGSLLVDISGFLTRDHLGVVAAMSANPEGGSYAIASDRSLPDTSSALAFPDNVEIDAFLTLTSAKPGREARVTAADGRAVTLVQHHSFVRLPPEGYKPRKFDPRTGAIEVAYYDFSAALDAPIVTRLARRFRLEREDPNATSGPVKKPIIFYVDPGAPPQIRDALIDGAEWWADAFEEAGFEDAYRVEVLPEDAHPFDIRYNMIQWTHRQTRGWSYGGGVSDPRTGEMLKANVILGSQRVRQDRMIFEGLAGTGNTGTGAADDPVEIALARIRQLSAHEVGHTLGFAHNFAASSNDRASVMDYPAPYVQVAEDGSLDFSEAYGVGIGAWDIHSAKWLYTEFPEGTDEDDALDAIAEEAFEQGLRFVGDREARSVGTAHPHGAVWDNGGDPVEALREALDVRLIALSGFGARALDDGQPLADLHKVIVPVYLYHRYQVAAAAKLVGGVDYAYDVKGGPAGPARPVPAADQRAALNALMVTLDPAELDLPDDLLNQMTPELGSFTPFIGSEETFDSKADPLFDVLAAADTAADITISALLHPARAARLVEFRRRDAAMPGFEEVLTTVIEAVFQPALTDRQQTIAEVVQARLVRNLIVLADNEDASAAVRAIASGQLRDLRLRIRGTDRHSVWLRGMINDYTSREAVPVALTPARPDVPPGSPIGDPGFMETCWHCASP